VDGNTTGAVSAEYCTLVDSAIVNGYARGVADGVEIVAMSEWYVKARGRRVVNAPTVMRADGDRVMFSGCGAS
jgi:hypothetical protein